jgi:hypothetical protein
MNTTTGIHLIDGRDVLAPRHVSAIQQLASACWACRDKLVAWDQERASPAPLLFAFINGRTLQVDVDLCAAAASRTRSLRHFFEQLLGPATHTLLKTCQDAYDAFYATTLEPAARQLFGPAESICLLPGRKLLLSGAGGQDQLLHLDSLWPTLVGNVYLRPAGAEARPLRATVFPEETGGRAHPRDLRELTDAEFDATLGSGSAPWTSRADVGPRTVAHNRAVLFCGNVVHGGPAPVDSPAEREAEPRIVMFQHVRPRSSPTADLSDYQEFEFSMFHRYYGATAPTLRALRATRGRWRDHFDGEEGDDFLTLDRLEQTDIARTSTTLSGQETKETYGSST